MVVTKHDVISEYLSEVTGYIPLLWDLFFDTDMFKRERYKRVCLSSVQRIDWFSSCVSNLHKRHVESVISPITTHKITWYLSPLLSAELFPSISSLDLVFSPI